MKDVRSWCAMAVVWEGEVGDLELKAWLYLEIPNVAPKFGGDVGFSGHVQQSYHSIS